MWPFDPGNDACKSKSLPLFPLKTVLFPGGLLPLKVFEQRYIDMAKTCISENRPFGVCLITQGEEVAVPQGAVPAISTVGTLAHIADWDMPQLGILHIATRGASRFRIRGYASTDGGLVVGEVTAIPDEPTIPLPEQYQPLARLLELIATRVGPQNFPATRNTKTLRGSVTGWPNFCRCRCRSSKACSRSTTPACGCRCCRNFWRNRVCSDPANKRGLRQSRASPTARWHQSG